MLMKEKNIFARFNNISISKKLYFVVGIMAGIVVLELFTLWFSINTLSSIRAFVGAEGLWSKAQKDARYQLLRYTRTQDEEDYKSFEKFMSVPLGFHVSLMELLKSNPDVEKTREGFLKGHVHPDDINGMINLFTRFRNVSYMTKATSIWIEADSLIGYFIPIGKSLHEEINSPVRSNERIIELINRIDPINQRLTTLDNDFAFTLGEGSRLFENFILTILFVVTLSMELIGLALAIAVSGGIRKGINEINRAADEIKKGNMTHRVRVFAKDEIGLASVSINEMTEQIIQSNRELLQSKEDFESMANKLLAQNKQLIEFAHITSHNLRAPASNLFSLLFLYKKSETSEEKEELFDRFEKVITHLSDTLNDLMSAIRIKEEGYKKTEVINVEDVTIKTIEILSGQILETGASIKYNFSSINKIQYNKSYMHSIILNLLDNAIKYRSPDRNPVIQIHSQIEDGKFVLYVVDNGLGIDLKRHGAKLFGLRKVFHRNKDAKGIGLFITKTQVEAMGGYITCKSEAGKGSVFIINFNSEL